MLSSLMQVVPFDNNQPCYLQKMPKVLQGLVLDYCLSNQEYQVNKVCKCWYGIVNKLFKMHNDAFNDFIAKEGIQQIGETFRASYPGAHRAYNVKKVMFEFYQKIFQKNKGHSLGSEKELVSYIQYCEDIGIVDLGLNLFEYRLIKHPITGKSLETAEEIHRVACQYADHFTYNVKHYGSIDLSSQRLFALGNGNNYDNLYRTPPKLDLLSLQIAKFSSLTFLSVNDNRLQFLPDVIGRLQCLKTFSARDNQLTEINPSIAKCTALTTLDLGHNRLGEVPCAISSLSSLCHLWLDHNRLTSLSTLKTSSLRTVSFSLNPLTSIEGISKLAQLRILYLYAKTSFKIPVKEIEELNNVQRITLNIGQYAAVKKSGLKDLNIFEFLIEDPEIPL